MRIASIKNDLLKIKPSKNNNVRKKKGIATICQTAHSVPLNHAKKKNKQNNKTDKTDKKKKSKTKVLFFFFFFFKIIKHGKNQ